MGLRTWRKKVGLTQVALAQKAKVSQGYITALERGRSANPSLAVLKRLAKALGVTVTDLIG